MQRTVGAYYYCSALDERRGGFKAAACLPSAVDVLTHPPSISPQRASPSSSGTSVVMRRRSVPRLRVRTPPSHTPSYTYCLYYHKRSYGAAHSLSRPLSRSHNTCSSTSTRPTFLPPSYPSRTTHTCTQRNRCMWRRPPVWLGSETSCGPHRNTWPRHSRCGPDTRDVARSRLLIVFANF